MPAPRQPRLLVIDDDPAITTLIARLLAPDGFAVAGAENEADALEMLCDPHLAWDGVIVDATLPLMQHGHLVKAISDAQPDLPIIVTSALDEESVRRLLRRYVTVFLAKPFGHPDLLAALGVAGIDPAIDT